MVRCRRKRVPEAVYQADCTPRRRRTRACICRLVPVGSLGKDSGQSMSRSATSEWPLGLRANEPTKISTSGPDLRSRSVPETPRGFGSRNVKGFVTVSANLTNQLSPVSGHIANDGESVDVGVPVQLYDATGGSIASRTCSVVARVRECPAASRRKCPSRRMRSARRRRCWHPGPGSTESGPERPHAPAHRLDGRTGSLGVEGPSGYQTVDERGGTGRHSF